MLFLLYDFIWKGNGTIISLEPTSVYKYTKYELVKN